jgi:hypothetical protein
MAEVEVIKKSTGGIRASVGRSTLTAHTNRFIKLVKRVGTKSWTFDDSTLDTQIR